MRKRIGKKKVYKKIIRKRGYKKNGNKIWNRKTQCLTIPRSLQRNMILPPILRQKFHLAALGYFDTVNNGTQGNTTANGLGAYSFVVNSVGSTAAGVFGSSHASLPLLFPNFFGAGTATELSIRPAGLSQILSGTANVGFYNRARMLAVKVKTRIRPNSALDSAYFVMVQGSDSISSPTNQAQTLPQTLITAADSPKSSRVGTQTLTDSQKWISLYIPFAQAYGVSKSALQANPEYIFSISSGCANEYNVGVIVQTMANTGLNFRLNIEHEITFYIQFESNTTGQITDL